MPRLGTAPRRPLSSIQPTDHEIVAVSTLA